MAVFSFDVVAPGEDWGLHCSLGLYEQFATWSMLVARPDHVLLVHDDALRLPSRGSREVRGPGLWADVHRHDPGRWQVNFEGVTLALDPADVARNEVGDLVPVEFEFEWEATGDLVGLVQPCMVDGEMAIGDGHLTLEQPTHGYWTHS